MTARAGRRLVLFCGVALAAAALLWFAARREAARPQLASVSQPPRVSTSAAQTAPASALAPAPSTEVALSGESDLAARLNAADGTIQADLTILNAVFEAWLTNFPRDGNPVGDNAEITRALTGDNVHRFAFIPPRHPAINARGELCDRWGTPFRFHQLSGRQMEIRSAGPDRKFGTEDDATLSPP